MLTLPESADWVGFSISGVKEGGLVIVLLPEAVGAVGPVALKRDAAGGMIELPDS